MAFYSTSAYWNERYQWNSDEDVLEDVFDWYVPYGVRTSDGSSFAEGIGLRDELNALLPHGERRASLAVLIVGCGISTLGEMMFDDGFQNILCVDASQCCIQRMRRRQELLMSEVDVVPSKDEDGDSTNKPKVARRNPIVRNGLRYELVDGELLTDVVERGSIDVVIDKAMLDASFCDDSVQRRYDRVSKILENIYDVLKPNGLFLHVTPHKDTGGCRGVIFRNPVLPWSNVSAVKLDLADKCSTSDVGSTAAAEFYAKPYWMFCLVK